MVPFPFLARPAKTLPEIPSYIVTYRNHRAVNERYACTPAEGMDLYEQHHLEEYTGHEFHKTVIGDGNREFMPEPATDTVLIILLEITICTEVIAHKDRHDFTLRKPSFTISYNVFHCCYRTVNIGFYSVRHSNSC